MTLLPTPYESVFDNNSVRVKLEETPHGVAISLDLMESGESTAGTQLYLPQEQIDGMAAWLDKRRAVRSEKREPKFGKISDAWETCARCGAAMLSVHPEFDGTIKGPLDANIYQVLPLKPQVPVSASLGTDAEVDSPAGVAGLESAPSAAAEPAVAAVNAYTERMIRHDQRERLEGSSTQTRSGGTDMTTHGTPLKPGQ